MDPSLLTSEPFCGSVFGLLWGNALIIIIIITIIIHDAAHAHSCTHLLLDSYPDAQFFCFFFLTQLSFIITLWERASHKPPPASDDKQRKTVTTRINNVPIGRKLFDFTWGVGEHSKNTSYLILHANPKTQKTCKWSSLMPEKVMQQTSPESIHQCKEEKRMCEEDFSKCLPHRWMS